MFMSQIKKLQTLDDLLSYSEDGRVELVNGEIVKKAIPVWGHGQSQGRLRSQIDTYDRNKGKDGPGGWWILTEPHTCYDDQNTFVHDLAGWRRERVPKLPKNEIMSIRPDWVCEILSKSTENRDRTDKMEILALHGVPHYWLVDFHNPTIWVLELRQEKYSIIQTCKPPEFGKLKPFEEIEIDLNRIFGLED